VPLSRLSDPSVMPALVAGIHVLLSAHLKTWMAGSSPAMTAAHAAALVPLYSPSTALVMMLRWISFEPP
jgi:hypothetical protein